MRLISAWTTLFTYVYKVFYVNLNSFSCEK